MQIFLLEGQTDRQTKDTIRGSPALYAAFTDDTHRPQRIHFGKNISVRFQSLGGGINPAGQNVFKHGVDLVKSRLELV